MDHRATGAQRVGFVLALIEAILLGLMAAMHFGANVAGYTTPFLYPAGIVEGMLALGLVVAIAIPGDGGVRGGRVLAAQILSVIGVFVIQVALAQAPALSDLRSELWYGGILTLSLASIAFVASPAFRRRVAS